MPSSHCSFLSRRARVVLVLALGSLASCTLLFFRYAATRQVGFGFLVWNLFLAWIPLGFAWLACVSRWPLWFRLPFAAAWLAFLPNTFYLVTDLQYLGPRPPVPLWWDILCLQSFAWNGLLLGFASLYWIHERIERRFGLWTGVGFAATVLGLCGLGVYLGRIRRWNSWEVAQRPLELLGDLLYLVRHPTHDRTALLFTIAFAAFFGVCYLMLWVLAGWRRAGLRERLDFARARP
ncbi:MAG: DUF1361 domain-containing protein [Planctomycetota bacterium]|nr:MAG: DUF1361 domain-containing protein [Planctomycetota bacterium]